MLEQCNWNELQEQTMHGSYTSYTVTSLWPSNELSVYRRGNPADAISTRNERMKIGLLLHKVAHTSQWVLYTQFQVLLRRKRTCGAINNVQVIRTLRCAVRVSPSLLRTVLPNCTASKPYQVSQNTLLHYLKMFWHTGTQTIFWTHTRAILCPTQGRANCTSFTFKNMNK